MNIYYVYAYLRKKDLTPYYIGKGKNNRAYRKHNVPVPRNRSMIVFLETGLTNIGACALERRYIKWYGRKDLGTGILRNRTDGGEGTPGILHTVERNQKISKKLKGRIVSDSTRKRLSDAHVGKQTGSNNGMFGKTHSEKVKNQHSVRMTGNKNSLGNKHSDETKKKLSIKAKSRELKTCPYCGISCSGSNYIRWHGDNCKIIFNEQQLIEHAAKFNDRRVEKIKCEYCNIKSLPSRHKYNHGINCSKNPKNIQKKEERRIQRLLNLKKITCEHCGKSANKSNYVRWHGNNCKEIAHKNTE